MRNLVNLRAWMGAIVFVAGLSVCGPAKAAPIVINFDSVNTSGGTVSGAPVLSYLAGFGISFSTSNPNVNAVIEPYPFWVSPVSTPNMFGPQGAASAFSYTLSFASPLNSISFTRPGFNPAIMSQWSATAFSSGNAVLASVGESLLFNAGPAAFSLIGPGIDHVTFTDNAFNFAGINFRMDNLTIDPQAVPEPGLIAMLVMALLLLAGVDASRRRIRA